MAMPEFIERRVTSLFTRSRTLKTILFTLTIAGAAPHLFAETLFFSGNLRTDATITNCNPAGCMLAPSDPDSTYAQWAAVVDTFTVTSTTTMEAITYSYGGGTSLTGATVAAGGLSPYLTLFDSAGNYLASTYFGTYCPTGASSFGGSCDDVALDGGTLAPGTYQIALTSATNLSFADLNNSGNISDGFDGLGNQDGTLNYAFDVLLPENTLPVNPPPVPEPEFAIPMGLALAAICRFRRCR